MRDSRRRLWLAGLLFVLAVSAGGCRPEASATTPTPVAPPSDAEARPAITRDEDDRALSQRRGRRIYFEGTSSSGSSIVAVIGSSREGVSAALVTCGNCHGRDGRGRPEGGIEPRDVRWSVLSKPLAATERPGRPAYTRALAGRAITMGLDAGGARLGDGMPRYRLSPEDLADLVAYLEVLGSEVDPGISPTSITLGTLLPQEQSAPELRQAIVSTVQAFADDLNDRGGLYNRKIVIQFEDMNPAPSGSGRDVEELLKRGPMFALLAPYFAGRDQEVARVVRDEGLPVIGPFSNLSSSGAAAERCIFHIHSAIDDQARALAIFAIGQPRARAPAIIESDDRLSPQAADAVAQVWARAGWSVPERIVIPGGEEGAQVTRLVERLAARGNDVIVYLGPAALVQPLLVAADGASYRPSVFLIGALSGGGVLDLPASFDGRAFLAMPHLDQDVTRSGHEDYAHLSARYKLVPDHRAAQLAVLAAARVLEEGLRRCGRDLSRAKLIDELERLEEFPTGYSRPVTFGPNRRAGTAGAHVLGADLVEHRFKPLGWTDVGRRQ
jgi:ABC-type branched-subunit amino acid transport system substrate-binding protein/cytochrome c553